MLRNYANALYNKTKSPFKAQICINISFQLLYLLHERKPIIL